MAWWNKKQIEKINQLQSEVKELKTEAYHSSPNNWVPLGAKYFDGEKTPGELGYLVDLRPAHRALRYRAFEAQLKSDFVKIITGKFFKWVVGTGLKLQAEPNTDVLETESISLPDPSKFRKIVEARFAIYSRSKYSDYQRMSNLHVKAEEAFYTAFLGGDCLCVLRIDAQSNLNVQVIDGEHIQTPVLKTEMMAAIKARGNTIIHGVELSPTGEHVAYFVKVKSDKSILGDFERVLAKGEKTGRTLAWMLYGDKHRIDHVRGIPVITQILEKIEKIDRYTEAAVGSAEERAKIVFAIEHTKDSDGSNPLLDKIKQAAGKGADAAPETSGYDLGEKTAATVAATTSKQTFNMPIGASLKALDSNSEMEFGPFSKAVFTFLCAAVDIPPEVALQLYEQNYSSSRAAINGWDYIVKIYRNKFADKFYQNFYNLWLELEIVKNKIEAPGFIKALSENNFMIYESYSKARFTGANMPHIDPLKEVKAIREMLGADDTTPLASREQAAEILGLGDWEKNIEKYKEETKIAPEKIEKNEPINS